MHMKGNRIIAIGDIHGRREWKNIVERNAGIRFVFLGDYFDPYSDIDHETMIMNILEIIRLKQKHPDDVVLLLGNHDMHYIDGGFTRGARYDSIIAPTVIALFDTYGSLFQYAYQDGNTLYTHAGVTDEWWTQCFMPVTPRSCIKVRGERYDYAAMLNNPTPQQRKAMYQVSALRSGCDKYGGIFWADKYETSRSPLRGMWQVVGHTKILQPETVVFDAETVISYCDCLAHGGFHVRR